jgi:hypothetical protein
MLSRVNLRQLEFSGFKLLFQFLFFLAIIWASSHWMEPVISNSLTDTTSGGFLLYFFIIVLILYVYLAVFASSCDHRCNTHIILWLWNTKATVSVMMVKWKTFLLMNLEAEITNSDSDSSLDIQALQWVEVKNSVLPHSTKNLRRTWDNLG